MAGKKGMKRPKINGKDMPNRSRVKKRHENWKESISAGYLMKRLKDHSDGKLDKPMDTTQIKAAEILLSRLVPTLSAVEQTNINPADQITEAQLFNNLATILQANPDLLPRLIALSIPPVEVGVDVGNAALLSHETGPAPTTH